MRIIKSCTLARGLLASIVLLLGVPAMAAGPLAICSPGQPFLWPNGGANVPFNPDLGNLGVLDNAQATQAVADAFQAWTDVPTATITYANAGNLSIDVDINNFADYLEAPAPDGLSAIVFDDTGEIFELLYGPDSGVLGFAGPEWADTAECTITEGYSFLNGPAIDSLEGLLNLMVHEFGHYSNLAHSEVNGQLFLGVDDTSGPGTEATFGAPPFPDGVEVIETMYTFLYSGIDQLTRTPNADDRASISQLYPEADFASSTATISGTIFLGNNPVTGVNVIARNVDNPFEDAVSGISSDFTDDFSTDSELTGAYTLRGLTPGANYAVYVDEILDGGFSTPPATPLPGPEEFYNGANESNDGQTDVPGEYTPVMASAGGTAGDIDILFNIPPPGLPLPIGDDGNIQVPLPFQFCAAGKAYDSAFINGNGFVTLGSADTDTSFLETEVDFLLGPPRIAGLWDDLNPEDGGTVIYNLTQHSFTVSWNAVPEYGIGGANTFSVTLRDNSFDCVDYGHGHHARHVHGRDGYGFYGGWRILSWLFNLTPWGKDVQITHGDISSTDGLVGVSTGIYAASGFEPETDLSADSRHGRRSLNLRSDAAVYELFADADVDTSGLSIEFVDVGKGYRDRFERNDSLDRAAKVSLPFDTIDTRRAFSSIAPEAADVDFYEFREPLQAGTTLVAEVLTGQIDSVLGLYRCAAAPSSPGWGHGYHGWHGGSHGGSQCDAESAVLVAANDDSSGLLSRISYEVPEDGNYALAVTFCCDYDFDGVDPGQGEPLDVGRYVLDAYVIDGVLLPLTDESYAEFPLGFEFPFQGNTYSSVFVNSNGYLSFGGDIASSYAWNVADFENGQPRIAPLWVDLDPDSGGTILASSDSSSATISFMGVPEYNFGGSNSFSVTLDAAGNVVMSYSGLTAPEGISGVSAGGGEAGTAVDLSSAPDWPAHGTTYEEFLFGLSEFDLDGSSLVFEP